MHCYENNPTHHTDWSELPIVGTITPKKFGKNLEFWIRIPIVGTFNKIRISTPTFGRYVSHFCANVPE